MCFWVILLFYSYGEYCFSGELENGDLFGGSVSFLNLDSENGNRKGAVQIINLGEIKIEISSINPTICNASDGEIIISGLKINVDYIINYNRDAVASSIPKRLIIQVKYELKI